MCKLFKKTPDDSFFEDLDPIINLWMHESWRKDQEERAEQAKYHAIFTGSFYNPQAAKEILSKENRPIFSTDEEFEQATQEVIRARNQGEKETQNNQRPTRRRKKLVKQT